MMKEMKFLPEQNRSVGEFEPPLPLMLPEHMEEKELESRGGSERRPSVSNWIKRKGNL